MDEVSSAEGEDGRSIQIHSIIPRSVHSIHSIPFPVQLRRSTMILALGIHG